MCSHYQAEKRRKQLEKRFGITLPLDWEPPPGGLHVYPAQMAPFIRRPPERESGDEAAPNFELVEGRFGLQYPADRLMATPEPPPSKMATHNPPDRRRSYVARPAGDTLQASTSLEER
ncbi:hypothetical protein J7E62_11230 [Variovorax paradoxus]|nr:hypothetical protein [Variovorax paradoxus]